MTLGLFVQNGVAKKKSMPLPSLISVLKYSRKLSFFLFWKGRQGNYHSINIRILKFCPRNYYVSSLSNHAYTSQLVENYLFQQKEVLVDSYSFIRLYFYSTSYKLKQNELNFCSYKFYNLAFKNLQRYFFLLNLRINMCFEVLHMCDDSKNWIQYQNARNDTRKATSET